MKRSEKPRWLDPLERDAWVSFVGVFMRLPVELDRQLQRDAGINMFDYRVLATLSEAPKRTLRMSNLAFLADGSLPRLSQVVKRLEQSGWIERTPDPIDGRYTLAKLTESGWTKVVEAAPGHVAAVRRLVIDPLSAVQIRQLNAVSNRINDAIDGMSPPIAAQPRAKR
jgi:DNA-binding MarR family transcriptional regulator